jgi:outer membrane protein assembly factor BamB
MFHARRILESFAYSPLAVILLGILAASCPAAEPRALPPEVERNWHQWRGPNANGVAPHGDPPVEWAEDRNIRWKVALPGEGSGTPIVWEDRIYLAAAIETDREAPQPPAADDAKTQPPTKIYQFVVLCFDRATGQELWRQVACEEVPHEGRHPTNTYASASPTTDGRRLYVWFGSRGLFCFDLDGTLLWRRDLGRLRTRFGWGEGTSPVVHGDSVVANCDQEEQSYITVLDAATGQVRWRADCDEPTTWATPLVVEHAGRTQVVVNGTNRVRSYDLATGEVLWQCGGQTVNAIPSPLAAGGVVYCMSGYRGAAARAIPLGATGDITDTDAVLWRHDEGTPYVPSPLVYNGRVYFTAANTGVLSCLDAATGKPVFDRQRLPGLSNVYASPAAAAGRLYFVGRDGAAVVLRDGPTLDVLAVNQLDDPVDASPAIVGRQLFLRGARHLYCIEEPAAERDDDSARSDAIDRALAFLSREVPRWSADNRCFSCHNNGDAARALFTALRGGRTIQSAALADTAAWLARPADWQHQNDAEEFSDPRLTPIQFGAALVAAIDAGAIDDRAPLLAAADILVGLQDSEGAWPIEPAAAIGSPVTYGTPLATVLARQVLAAADARRHADAIDNADRWLRRQAPTTVLSAAALLLGLGDAADDAAAALRQSCRGVIAAGRHEDGGWGPYVQSASEPFDTALVLSALAADRAGGDPNTLAGGRRFLIGAQRHDGSWKETTRPAGAESYAQRLSTAAWAVMALLAERNNDPPDHAVAR